MRGLFPPTGPRPTVFGPLEVLGRTPRRVLVTTLVAALLMAGIVALALPEAPQAVWVVSIAGASLGYLAHRRRSHRPWLQITLSMILPCTLAALFVTVSESPGAIIASIGFIPVAVLGHCASRGAERVFGPRRKIRRAAWEGVTFVGGRYQPEGVRFDVRPLTATVSKAWAREMRTQVTNSSLAVRAAVLKWLFIIAAPILVLVIITGYLDVTSNGGDDVAAQLLGFSAVVMLLALGYGIIAWFGFRGSRHATSLADHVRFSKFAEHNGFEYTPGPVADRHGRELSRVMTTTHGRTWTIANATRSEPLPAESSGAGTVFSGFCEIQLRVPLPNILLISRTRTLPAFSAPAAPLASQRLSLEGDFDRYFEVYCPAGYERDALYILTPDVMANLVDSARGTDVEFIDDRLVLRTRRDMVTADPGAWQRIAIAVSALNGRLEQWERWRDDRHEGETPASHSTARERLLTEKPRGAALAGRRLRLGLSLGGALAIAYIGIYSGLVLLAN